MPGPIDEKEANGAAAAAGDGTAPAAAVAGTPDPGTGGSEGSEEKGAAAEATSGEKEGKPAGEKPAAEARQEDWREARLRVETAKRREAEAKVRELEARQSKPAAAAADADGPGKPRFSEADVERLADQKAAMQSQWRAFSDACDATAAQGRRDFTDFDSRVGEILRLVDKNDLESQGAYNRFLAAAIETGKATEILHALGGDLNEAQRIMALAPVKMAVEMTKLALAPAKDLSRAPKPINAITSRGANHVQISPDDPERADNLSTAEWIKRREAQVAERGVRR